MNENPNDIEGRERNRENEQEREKHFCCVKFVLRTLQLYCKRAEVTQKFVIEKKQYIEVALKIQK